MTQQDEAIDRQLTRLVDDLRRQGGRIGLPQHLDAQRLLLHGRLNGDAAQIERLLGPVLCRSPREQAEFPVYFRPWAKALLTVGASPVVEAAQLRPEATEFRPGHGDAIARRSLVLRVKAWSAAVFRAIRRHSAILMLIMLSAILAWVYLFVLNVSPLLWAPGLLILGIIVLRNLARLRTAFLTRRQSAHPPVPDHFSAAGVSDQELHHSIALAHSAQRLRRHSDQSFGALDLPRTLERSLRAGNWFTPVYRRRKRTPEYLVLIDRSTFGDHQAQLALSLVRHLRDAEMVAIDPYFFDRDLRYCVPPGSGEAGVNLLELKQRHPEHRLMLFSDGAGFFDRYGGRVHSWVEQVHFWDAPALFMLAISGDGDPGARLTRTLGLRVFSADERGVSAFAAQLERPEALARAHPLTITPLPPLLTRLPRQWLARQAPEQLLQEQLVSELQGYLGDEGFTWLAACAVYPELHWPLTLEIGERLKMVDRMGALTRLASLPWLRHGRMPDWFRLALLDALGDREARVRHQVEEMIRPESGLGLRLEYAIAGDQAPAERLSTARAARDAVFLSFLGNRLSVRVAKLKRHLYRPLRRSLASAGNWLLGRRKRWLGSMWALWQSGWEGGRSWFSGLVRYYALVRQWLRSRGRPLPGYSPAVAGDVGGDRGTDPRQFRDHFRDGSGDAPEMLVLPGGEFMMGDEQRSDDEKPVHRVRLDAFAIGRTPLTWGEYLRFCEATGEHWPEWLEKGSKYHLMTGSDQYYAKRGVQRYAVDLPVVGVSWDDARSYCEWLGEQTGEQYALPTEAQWKYACRAGTETRWSFGDDEKGLDDYGWYIGNAGSKLHPVAGKGGNPWGVYDMHGNVWEWCADWYAEDYYEKIVSADSVANGGAVESSGLRMAAPENPRGPKLGSLRVVRGGSWYDDAVYCRSAYRLMDVPLKRHVYFGFRLSRTV